MLTFLLLACHPAPESGTVNGITASCEAEFCTLALNTTFYANGEPLQEGLTASDFSLQDISLEFLDGTLELDVDTAEVADVDAEILDADSLDVAILLDTSGSMDDADPEGIALEAAGQVAKSLIESGHRVAIYSFPRDQDQGEFEETDEWVAYTDDLTLIDQALQELQDNNSGGTPLYDSLLEVMEAQSEQLSANVAGAVMVLTDGKASGDSEYEDVVEKSQELGIPLYVAGLGENLDFDELQALAAGSAGLFISAEEDNLGEALSAAGQAVYGAVTVEVAVQLTDDSDPLLVGSYKLGGSLWWNRVVEVPLDTEFYLSDVGEE